jgi:O-antigen biosynthesis protein WbqP
MISRIVAVSIFILFSPLLFLISILIFSEDGFPVLFRQNRVGLHNSSFTMYKFRTMKLDTPNVATHLLTSPEHYVLKIGKILRKLSLDELPNLMNIINGDMNFIGPRPALYNQDDLIDLRTVYEIHHLVPGLTGWAQVNGRDSIPIEQKVNLEKWYIDNKSPLLDLKILFLTFYRSIAKQDVSH